MKLIWQKNWSPRASISEDSVILICVVYVWQRTDSKQPTTLLMLSDNLAVTIRAYYNFWRYKRRDIPVR